MESTLNDLGENVSVPNGNYSDFISLSNLSNSSHFLSTEEMLLAKLGPRRQDLHWAVILLILYSLLFISGTLGNICTCIVIARNGYMHTTTNYYLFSLAISDVLMLLLGLPQEAYTIWEAYPWRLGEAFCIIKALVTELTSNASVLTITAFTMERYFAICHPLKAQKIADLSRSVKIILGIWVISLLCALPYPLHTKIFYYILDANQVPLADSLICNIPDKYYETMSYIFQLSTFVFFVFPMTVITVLYVLIALELRKATLQRASSGDTGKSASPNVPAQSRKAVLRMLIAVVVAFFVCWAPFHAQRLFTIYNRHWTPFLLELQSTLFYVSGVLYFVSSTVNPIFYNLMSRRYREAFKDVICKCRRKRAISLYGSSVYQYYAGKSVRHKSPTNHTELVEISEERSSLLEENEKATDTISGRISKNRLDINNGIQRSPRIKTCNHAFWTDKRNGNSICRACHRPVDGKRLSKPVSITYESIELLQRSISEETNASG